MNWVGATYNRLESFAMAADRVLNALVERCEMRLAGRAQAKLPAGKDTAAQTGKSRQPLSA